MFDRESYHNHMSNDVASQSPDRSALEEAIVDLAIEFAHAAPAAITWSTHLLFLDQGLGHWMAIGGLK